MEQEIALTSKNGCIHVHTIYWYYKCHNNDDNDTSKYIQYIVYIYIYVHIIYMYQYFVKDRIKSKYSSLLVEQKV